MILIVRPYHPPPTTEHYNCLSASCLRSSFCCARCRFVWYAGVESGACSLHTAASVVFHWHSGEQFCIIYKCITHLKYSQIFSVCSVARHLGPKRTCHMTYFCLAFCCLVKLLHTEGFCALFRIHYTIVRPKGRSQTNVQLTFLVLWSFTRCLFKATTFSGQLNATGSESWVSVYVLFPLWYAWLFVVWNLWKMLLCVAAFSLGGHVD